MREYAEVSRTIRVDISSPQFIVNPPLVRQDLLEFLEVLIRPGRVPLEPLLALLSPQSILQDLQDRSIYTLAPGATDAFEAAPDISR